MKIEHYFYDDLTDAILTKMPTEMKDDFDAFMGSHWQLLKDVGYYDSYI